MNGSARWESTEHRTPSYSYVIPAGTPITEVLGFEYGDDVIT